MLTYCLKCKKVNYNKCPKKLIMMTNIKIKGTSRCANGLAIKSFVDKVKENDELEVTASQFLIDFLQTKHANLLCEA